LRLHGQWGINRGSFAEQAKEALGMDVIPPELVAKVQAAIRNS